jgi:hypothetical protein
VEVNIFSLCDYPVSFFRFFRPQGQKISALRADKSERLDHRFRIPRGTIDGRDFFQRNGLNEHGPATGACPLLQVTYGYVHFELGGHILPSYLIQEFIGHITSPIPR